MPDEFEIRRAVPLPAPPDVVWRAIATGPGLAGWFMDMVPDPDDATVVAWEPGRRLAIELPPGEDGSSQAFEYLIEARAGGTAVLRFVHSGFLGDDWGDEFEAMTGAGWDMYLATLAAYLTHFPDRPARYAEAEGPAASATAAAWPRLLAALDLRAAPSVGSTVRVDVRGLGAVEGVVDYATPSFLGLRTADALVRFHGRWAIGMVVAVGHHATDPGFDPAAATAAWTGWLGSVLAGDGTAAP